VLGVIGHVDHGKTALVRALTGIETDRLPEERRRGISIALGFAHAPIGGAEVDFVDMPGHERFVRTMVSGATGIGAALLVVAANEGVMPQTREHVDIAGLLGVARAVVAVTKADLVSPEEAARVGEAAAALARGAGMTAAPPVAVSALTGAGLDALKHAIAAALDAVPASADAGFAYLPVDRAFSVAGHGTVVTGTLRRGTLLAGDAVEAVPSVLPVRVRGLQVHGVRVAQAEPGQRVAVNLRGVEPGQVGRGTALATPGLLASSAWLSVELRAVESAPPLANGSRLALLFGTEEVGARLRLLDREALEPGETALAQVQCAEPVAVPARERFILRVSSPALTVAGGWVLDPEARRLRRHAAPVLARLRALAEATPAQVVAREVEAAGAQGVALDRLARLAGLSPARVVDALQVERPASAVLGRGRVAIARPALDAVLARLPGVLAGQGQIHPDGLSRQALATLVPEASSAVLDEVVAQLVARGTLRQEGGLVRVLQLAREADRARAERDEAARLAERLRQGGLSPPDPHEIAPDPPMRRLLDRLVREGTAVRALDRVQKREVLFHRDAVDAARRHLAPLLAGATGGLLAREVGAALGISRKYSIPLLEHLDATGFTRRIADRRVLAQTP
jgi:selenocysteine-specific elongation factor